MAKYRLRKKRIILLCLIILIIFSIPFIKDFLIGKNSDNSAQVTIPDGAGTITISQILHEEEVISHPKFFQLIAKIKNIDSKWQSGTVVIPKGSGYTEIFQIMTSVAYTKEKVTIPEGKQVKQIAEILEKAEICSKEDFLTACEEHNFDYPFLTDIDHENRLEGYLFPDTYYFEKNSDPDTVIKAMLNRFQQKVYENQDYQNKAKQLGYSLDDIIILASMCESEATTEEDRKLVAGVFYNRLNNNDKLQSCVTVEYAMGVKKAVISLADTKYNSPYNTYMHYGLPIGPICCPGLVSIEAALYPADTDYYYFQSDQYGKLYFATTYQEHKNIQYKTHENWDY